MQHQHWIKYKKAFEIANANGYKGTPKTFRRDLEVYRRTGIRPNRLKAVGLLKADWAKHDQSSNQRWLKMEATDPSLFREE